MEWYEAGLLLIGVAIMLMAIGMPVAFVFIAVSSLGMVIFFPRMIGLKQLVANATSSITTFALIPIPLFLLMGELFFHTRVATRVFDAFDAILGRLPGRLSYLTVFGGTVFATLSGSSMGNTAMLGSLMVPEMLKRGYKKGMAFGPILGTGGLAMIIPPSALAVLYGSLAHIDIGKLLIAGLIPGVVLASFYILIIFFRVKFDPDAAPGYDVRKISLKEKIVLVSVNLLPMCAVIFVVIGLILFGIATPSEAAAFGVLGVLILATAFRSLTWEAIKASIYGTLKTTGMIFLIIIGSSTFSQVLAISGATSGILNWVTSLNVEPMLVALTLFLIVLFLGMLMEQISIMMLTIPIFVPLAPTLGFDLVWFGVIMLLALEVSLITPPFGLGLFVLMGVAPKGTTLWQVSAAAFPYVLATIGLVLLLMWQPTIATYLPNTMQ